MFKKDELVWAKSTVARQIYWPAKDKDGSPIWPPFHCFCAPIWLPECQMKTKNTVIDFISVLTCHLRKPVIACVQFLVEHTHEAITDSTKLLPFNCEQKHTFLKKGRGLKDPFKRLQFDSAVNQAEKQIQSHGRQCSPKMSPAEAGKSTGGIRRTSPRKTPVSVTPKDFSKILRSSSRELAVNITDESTRIERESSEKSTEDIPEKSKSQLRKGSKRTRPSGEDDIENSRKHGRKNELVGGVRSVKKKLYKSKEKDRRVSPRKASIKITNKKNLGKRNTSSTTGEDDGNTRVSSSVSDSTPNGLNGVSSSIPNGICEDSPGLSNTSGETVVDNKHETNKPMSNFVPKSMLKDDFKTTVHQDKSKKKDAESVCNGQNNEDDNKNINLENSKNYSSSDDDDEDESFPEAFSPSPGLESIDFQQGDVVWAKYRKFPYWPSQIGRLTRKRKLTHYYVYLLPKGRHKCLKVKKSNVISFAHDHERYKNQEIKSIERDEFDQALKEAEDILASRVSHKDSNFFPEDKDRSICSTLPSDNLPLSPMDEKEDTNGFEEDEEFSANKTDINTVECDSLITPERRKSQRRKRSTSKYNEILLEFHSCKSRLVKIYHEKVPSDRHQKFHYGTVAEKDFLKHKSGFGPVHDDDICQEIIDILRTWYKKVVQKQFGGLDYIFDVWLPEAIIFCIQNIENVSQKEAEVIFLDNDRNAADEDMKDVTLWLKEHKNKMDKGVMQEIEDRSKQAF